MGDLTDTSSFINSTQPEHNLANAFFTEGCFIGSSDVMSHKSTLRVELPWYCGTLTLILWIPCSTPFPMTLSLLLHLSHSFWTALPSIPLLHSSLNICHAPLTCTTLVNDLYHPTKQKSLLTAPCATMK